MRRKRYISNVETFQYGNAVFMITSFVIGEIMKKSHVISVRIR